MHRLPPRPLRPLGAALLLALAPGCGREPARRPNVLLISIDTLRADHLGCYGYDRPTSPTLDALARDGVLFERTFASSSWTLPSHASLLTSRHPAGHGAETRDQGLGRGVKTLAQTLRRAGYTTAAFTTWIYVSERYGLDRGFQTFEYLLPGSAASPGGLSDPAAPAADVVERVRRWLGTAPEEPWFLFLHFIDPHMEYSPPLEHARLFDPELEDARGGDYGPLDPYLRRDGREAAPVPADVLERAVALYDGEIHYTDEEIGRVLELLGGARDALVVVTADHGEEFSEHHALMSHGLTLYDEMLHVPLIVRFPGAAHAGTRSDELARSIDVAPTVLATCGVPVPEEFDGRSLLPAARGLDEPDAYAFSSTRYSDQRILWSVRTATEKLVFTADRDGGGHFELYDLVVDPGETRDVYDPADRRCLELRGVLEKWMASGAEAAPGAPVELTPREKKRLEALGYVSDGG